VVIPVASLPTSLTVPNTAAVGLYLSIGGLVGTPQSNLNSWQSGNYGSATTATNWAATANNFISLTNLQLESGTVATQFERESYALTLQKCQRYFQYIVTNGASFNGIATNSTTAYAFGQTLFVPMRATPTATLTGTWGYAGGGGTVSAQATTNSSWYMQSSSGSFTAGYSSYFNNSGGGGVGLSAEL
jgi:hypothetical protein